MDNIVVYTVPRTIFRMRVRNAKRNAIAGEQGALKKGFVFLEGFAYLDGKGES